MANLGYVESALGGLKDDVKKPVLAAFEYVLKNLSFGAVDHQTKATNVSAVWVTGTTSSVANQEFTIAHGLERTPTFAMPVAPLGTVNAQTVAVTVSRAADGVRVYLKSASTSASIALLVG